LLLGERQDRVAIPQMRPVLLNSGGARHDVLVHQRWPELGRGDRAERRLYRCHTVLFSYARGLSTIASTPRAPASRCAPRPARPRGSPALAADAPPSRAPARGREGSPPC